MDGYVLTRKWFDFAFVTKECKSYHTALYLWIVELNNRLQWKPEFGLPTHDTMEGLSIGNKQTYLNTLRDIEKWGFIKVIQASKNQYQSCIIKIMYSKNASKKLSELDKVLLQNRTGTGNDTGNSTGDSTGVSTVPIDKQLNNETIKQDIIDFEIFWKRYGKTNGKKKTLDLWSKMKDDDKRLAFEYLDVYKLKTPDTKFRKDAERYLKNMLWLDGVPADSENENEIPVSRKLTPEEVEVQDKRYVELMGTRQVKPVW